MPYLSVADAKTFLQGFEDLTNPNQYDTLIESIITSIETHINRYLGFSFNGYAAATKTIENTRYSHWIRLPSYNAGTIESITSYETNKTVVDYEEDPDAGLFTLYRSSRWPIGRYAIVAEFGYGPCPADVLQVIKELVVNIWLSKQAGKFSDVVGSSDGGNMGYEKALTQYQFQTLERVRMRYIDPF